jgi:hypothetical protein
MARKYTKRNKATAVIARFIVTYFCTFTRREYSYTVNAASAQEAADKCREINGIATGAEIRIMDVCEQVTHSDWN